MRTLAFPFFIGSSSFLQIKRLTIKALMGLKVDKIGPGSAELATLERLKKIFIDLLWEKCCEHSRAFISN